MSDEAPDVRDLIAHGAQLYNDGQFWEAHEAWEEAWLALKDAGERERADLVQGLILATAAFENLSRGKPSGFATQGAKALHRLRESGEALAELGVANAARFADELLDVYLDVQRRKVSSLDGLDRQPPRLAAEE